MVWLTINDIKEHHDPSIRCVAPHQSKSANVNTLVDHLSALNINSQPSLIRLTGIACTIGPACLDTDTIEEMIANGMNIACLNLSRHHPDFHAEAIKNIRIASENYSKKMDYKCPVAIAVTTKGPRIRTGLALGGPCALIELKEGEIIKLTTDPEYTDKGTSEILFVDYENITKVVKIGYKICMDKGNISLICTSVGDFDITCVIERGGFIGSRKRLDLLGASVDLPALFKKDKNHLLFALEQKVDIFLAPFVRYGPAIKEIREVLGADSKIKIIAKIENAQSLINADEIIKAFDGVMLVRDRLGIEIPPEQVFISQKSVIAKCNIFGKSAICSSHFLESMVKKPRPTRAEASDIANAVLDGADCLMLCAETSRGDYPLEAIRCLADVCKEAEAAFWRNQFIADITYEIEPPVDTSHANVVTAADVSVICGASAIVVVTNSFHSARLLSKYRPRCPIIAVTRDAEAAKKAHLYRGILPLVFKSRKIDNWFKHMETRVYYAINFGRKKGFINPGDTVVALTSSKQGNGFNDKLKIIQATKRVLHGTVCVC